MGDSIIYVGSRNMSRTDCYYKKDNWGMYRQPLDDQKEVKQFYKDLTRLGRCTSSNKSEAQTRLINEFRNKNGQGIISNKVIRKVFCAYNDCYKDVKTVREKNQLIKRNLEKYLKQYGVHIVAQKNILKYDPAFKVKKETKNNLSSSKTSAASNKHDMFYKQLCSVSRRVIPIANQPRVAHRLLRDYDNKISSEKTVLAVLNAYFLCCYKCTTQQEKNTMIKKNLEKYLMRTKVDARIRRRILEIEKISS